MMAWWKFPSPKSDTVNMIKLSSYGGSPFLGVYCVASENYSLLPLDAGDEFVADLEEALQVKAIRCNIAGSHLVGSLSAMNSFGTIVSSLIEADELARMPKDMNVHVLLDQHNAAGNNILANDFGAIVNPNINKTSLKMISKTLNVECVQSTIAGIDTVGAICRATNKGVVCHPATTEENLELLRKVLKVDAYRSTLNHGTTTVGACLVANGKGALVGDSSTSIELGRLEDALHYY